MIRVAPILAALAATPAHAAGPDTHRAERTIRLDLGGDVGARANRIAALRASGFGVRITGTCMSACTMYLAIGCVTHDAVLGFHRPSFYGADLPPEKFEYWSRVIADHYPAPIRDWYLREGRYAAQPIRITGDELIRLGVKECD